MSDRGFEDLLADPCEQFDPHGEVADRLLASIAEYMNAPTATASTTPSQPRTVRLRVVPSSVPPGDTPEPNRSGS